ncbi:MAG: sulfatase, partial [Acidimicrobiales bacterium]|nr:sulfatase [Acidimicrobiales bacterium]
MTARRPPRSRLAAALPFLELLGLSGLAVASPVLQVFSDGAEVFVAYRASRFEIVLFALGVVLVVPAVLFAVELLAGLAGERWRRLAHAGAVFLLLAALVLQVAKTETELKRRPLLALAVGLALLGAAAVWRWNAPRLFLRFLSLSSVVFLVTFLLASPVTALVVPSRGVEAADIEVGAPAPVVWIVFDEFPLVSLLGPDDRIDAG